MSVCVEDHRVCSCVLSGNEQTPIFFLVSCLATPIKTFLKKVRSRDSGTHKYFCITKDQVTTMVVFLLPEDKERWGQDLHRTTDASVCVVTKDKKQKVMG